MGVYHAARRNQTQIINMLLDVSKSIWCEPIDQSWVVLGACVGKHASLVDSALALNNSSIGMGKEYIKESNYSPAVIEVIMKRGYRYNMHFTLNFKDACYTNDRKFIEATIDYVDTYRLYWIIDDITTRGIHMDLVSYLSNVVRARVASSDNPTL
jgi:hypothetical protein